MATPPFPMSNKDANQVLKYAFDDATGRLRVDAIAVLGPGGISAADGDNIAISDGTNTVVVNPDGSLNIATSAPLDVTATDLDIRDLDANQDSVSISDGTDTLEINPDGSINTQTTIAGEVSIEISAADGDNIAISDGVDTMSVNADGSINVVVASSALPTGSATAANQVTGNASLTSIDSKLTSPLTVQANNLDIRDLVFATDKVDASGSSVSVSSSVLPTGAATLVAQNTGNASLSSIDTKLTSPLTINLPTGASTSALQTTGNSSLSSIDGKLNSLGQKTSANSVPVVIASDQSAISAKAATPTAGTVTQAAITVGTTAVRATVTGSAPSANRSVLIVNPDSTSTAKFYVGTSTVTSTGATRGLQLLGGDKVAFNSDAGDYYIISDTAAQTVYIVEQA